MSQRTDVTSSVRTQQIRYINPDWTYPARGAVLAVADNVGTMVPTTDPSVKSLGLAGPTGSVGKLTFDGTNLLVNGEPIKGSGGTTGDMSGDTIYLGTLVLTASGDYIRVKSETNDYIIRPGGGGGTTGSVGPRGATGVAGATGRPGPIGATGTPGLLGPTGAAGTPGAPGVAGPTGVMGPTGSVGPRGASGNQGIAGPTGPAGIGTMGPAGNMGPIGPTGLRGIAGVTGPTGPMGALQAAGTPGTYLSPTSITTNAYGQVTSVVDVGQSIPNGTYAYPTSITTAGGYVKAVSTSTNAVATVAGGSGIVVTGGTTPTATIALATAGAGAATYASPTSLTLDAYGRVTGVLQSGNVTLSATTMSAATVITSGGWKAPSLSWSANPTAGLYSFEDGVAICSAGGPVCYMTSSGFHVDGGPIIADSGIVSGGQNMILLKVSVTPVGGTILYELPYSNCNYTVTFKNTRTDIVTHFGSRQFFTCTDRLGNDRVLAVTPESVKFGDYPGQFEPYNQTSGVGYSRSIVMGGLNAHVYNLYIQCVRMI